MLRDPSCQGAVHVTTKSVSYITSVGMEQVPASASWDPLSTDCGSHNGSATPVSRFNVNPWTSAHTAVPEALTENRASRGSSDPSARKETDALGDADNVSPRAAVPARAVTSCWYMTIRPAPENTAAARLTTKTNRSMSRLPVEADGCVGQQGDRRGRGQQQVNAFTVRSHKAKHAAVAAPRVLDRGQHLLEVTIGKLVPLTVVPDLVHNRLSLKAVES